jgi:hypothetical protein
MIEKTWDRKDGNLWCCLVDFRKAFDTLLREKLWERQVEMGFPNEWRTGFIVCMRKW